MDCIEHRMIAEFFGNKYMLFVMYTVAMRCVGCTTREHTILYNLMRAYLLL